MADQAAHQSERCSIARELTSQSSRNPRIVAAPSKLLPSCAPHRRRRAQSDSSPYRGPYQPRVDGAKAPPGRGRGLLGHRPPGIASRASPWAPYRLAVGSRADYDPYEPSRILDPRLVSRLRPAAPEASPAAPGCDVRAPWRSAISASTSSRPRNRGSARLRRLKGPATRSGLSGGNDGQNVSRNVSPSRQI